MTSVYSPGYVVADRVLDDSDRQRVSEICSMKIGRRVEVLPDTKGTNTALRIQLSVHELNNIMRFPNEGERAMRLIVDPHLRNINFMRPISLSGYKITVLGNHQETTFTSLILRIDVIGELPGVSV